MNLWALSIPERQLWVTMLRDGPSYSWEINDKNGINTYLTVEIRNHSINVFPLKFGNVFHVWAFSKWHLDMVLHVVRVSNRWWRASSFWAPFWDLGYSHTWIRELRLQSHLLWSSLCKSLQFHPLLLLLSCVFFFPTKFKRSTEFAEEKLQVPFIHPHSQMSSLMLG